MSKIILPIREIKSFEVNLPKGIVDQGDTTRGDIPFSKYLLRLVEKKYSGTTYIIIKVKTNKLTVHLIRIVLQDLYYQVD